jgi:hypothetical protein
MPMPKKVLGQRMRMRMRRRMMRRRLLAGTGTGGIVGAVRPHLEPRLLDWSV